MPSELLYRFMDLPPSDRYSIAIQMRLKGYAQADWSWTTFLREVSRRGRVEEFHYHVLRAELSLP